jgi:hypothetical protein
MNTDLHNWHPSAERRNDETSEKGGKGRSKWTWDSQEQAVQKSDVKCGLLEDGFSITIMHLFIQHCQLDNSWQVDSKVFWRWCTWQNIQFLPFQNPSYSYNVSSPDIFLFPTLKITFKGSIFQTVEDIITNATNDLMAIPQTSFKQCFQKWKRR